MALFGKKTKKVEEKAPKTEKSVTVAPVSHAHAAIHGGMAAPIIIRPRVTEKSHILSEKSNVYIFNVKENVTKGMVKEAVKEIYKISPVKVSIMPVPNKSRFVRGRKGFAGGGRKAYVYFKKEDKLEIN